MGEVIIKPLVRIAGQDGPIYVTEVSGAVVHGSKPLTEAGRDFLAEVIEAARVHMSKPKQD